MGGKCFTLGQAAHDEHQQKRLHRAKPLQEIRLEAEEAASLHHLAWVIGI